MCWWHWSIWETLFEIRQTQLIVQCCWWWRILLFFFSKCNWIHWRKHGWNWKWLYSTSERIINKYSVNLSFILCICLPDCQHSHWVEKLKGRSTSQMSTADRFSAYLIETYPLVSMYICLLSPSKLGALQRAILMLQSKINEIPPLSILMPNGKKSV